MNRLENKTALITGGAGSIGQQTAKVFLAEGAKVFLVDLNEEGLQKTLTQLASKDVRYCTADVSKSVDVKRYVDEAINFFGKIDIFFNNAGIEGVVKPIAEYPEDVFDEVISVNVKGVWLGAKYVLPQMNDGGSMIITSSVAGLNGTPNVSAYITSKHAVVGVMRATALEVAGRRIRVNSVHPSPVENRMMRSLEEGFAPGAAKEAHKNFEKAIPLGRYATVDEISRAVLFLAGEDSRFITGTTVVVDGGMSAQ